MYRDERVPALWPLCAMLVVVLFAWASAGCVMVPERRYVYTQAPASAYVYVPQPYVYPAVGIRLYGGYRRYHR